MTTEQPIAPSVASATIGDPEKALAELDRAMNGTKLQDTSFIPASPSDSAFEDASEQHEAAGEATNGSAHPPANDPLAAIKALNLPLSSANNPINAPFAQPLETSKPVPRAELTQEQVEKYENLLSNVEKLTELPETSARGAPNVTLEDDERMFLTRECLLRYLRATTWNVANAETRLKNTIVWRREYGIKKIVSDYIGIENETGKQVILGWDNEGRPCQYLRPHKQNTERSDRQIQHLVYMLERSIDLMPAGQETLVLVINFGETKAGQGVTLGQGKQVMNILQNHYPERLGRALISNVPFYIWGFFKLITPFIDPLTRQKLKFNENSGLHVPPEQLLKSSGGLVDFEYDHTTYWPALTKLTELRAESRRLRWEKAGKRVGESEFFLKGGTDKSVADSATDAAA